ncbi:MAG: YggS family pyridoxal phosphate-dependent enzyme [Planctomycetota bacterium]
MSEVEAAANYRHIREELPEAVTLVVAAKGRRSEQIRRVIEAGAKIVGQNYVQEAEGVMAALGETAGRAEWHMIGHLQRNKVNTALELFDAVQSLDSPRLARAINRRADEPVRCLVEVNIAGEESKYGIPPEEVEDYLRQVGSMENLQVEGLMTMEPYFENAEDARPYLRRMRALFEQARALELPGIRMEVLSMGMTNSWRVAVEEGATMVRIGTAIFGPRR